MFFGSEKRNKSSTLIVHGENEYLGTYTNIFLPPSKLFVEVKSNQTTGEMKRAKPFISLSWLIMNFHSGETSINDKRSSPKSLFSGCKNFMWRILITVSPVIITSDTFVLIYAIHAIEIA